jgi:deoxycytidylate deaminase
MLINAGIKTFIFEHPYNDELAKAMMDEAGIETIMFKK